MEYSRDSMRRGHAERDDAWSSSSSQDSEFTDIAVGEEDTLRRPTMVQLPPRSHHLSTPQPPPVPVSHEGLLDIDPDVLKELPPEIQQEVLLERAAAEKRANDAAIQATLAADSQNGSSANAGSETDEGSIEAIGGASDGTWVCHVCTFANHPQIFECEMCDTLCASIAAAEWDTDDERRLLGARPPARRVAPLSEEDSALFDKVSQRLQSSVMTKSLKKIRLPATPATTSLTHKEDPTAEDLLVAATVKIQKLQQNASQSIKLAKNSLLAKANAARQISSASSERATNRPTRMPSGQAAAVLRSLQRDLNTKCVAGDELYESLLVRLWNAIYQDVPPRSPRASPSSPRAASVSWPRRPFERISDAWVDIGFQGPNPDSDFRGGGLLALKCLVYVFEAHPHKMMDIVVGQKPTDGAKKWYPVCVAGINLTCMIAGLLKLGNGHFDQHAETFWALFEEPSAFYQLFFHAIVKMDAAWHRMNATFMEFGVVLKATRRMVIYILDQAPESLADLRLAADKTFIDRFVVSVSSAFLADSENGECPDPFSLLEDEAEVLLTSPRGVQLNGSARLAPVAPLR
ncbi:hypothetical protein ATCC90586_000955 [Pythium insidiosum]|nr:hypothetical protein ATCC90586_000955 [Pythium insidiosum]